MDGASHCIFASIERTLFFCKDIFLGLAQKMFLKTLFRYSLTDQVLPLQTNIFFYTKNNQKRVSLVTGHVQ